LHDDFFEDNVNSVGLFAGRTGLALFCYHYARFSGRHEFIYKANSIINSILFDLERNPIVSDFASGLAGIGWGMSHLIDHKFIGGIKQNILENFNLTLHSYLKHFIESGTFDFLSGALGIGLFYIKSEYNQKELYLNGLINFIENNNPLSQGPSIFKFRSEEGDLGLAHGLSSILAFLAKLYKENIQCNRIKILINNYAEFILRFKLEKPNSINVFPNYISNSTPIFNNRLAWCYGDLGIGFAFLRAAYAINDISLFNKSIEILTGTLGRRNLADTLVFDACLCHGSAGNAHMYARIYYYTRNPKFKDAALFWYEDILNKATHKSAAGFNYYLLNDWRQYYSFLEGISGIGLVLISGLSDNSPDWDECLLLS
jgi:lantibiotic modifying enzyme